MISQLLKTFMILALLSMPFSLQAGDHGDEHDAEMHDDMHGDEQKDGEEDEHHGDEHEEDADHGDEEEEEEGY